MPVDYHKWDHIEVSDDEDDTHPNVDTASLYRWRHQARLDRMAETKHEKEELTESKNATQRKINEIKQKINAIDSGDPMKTKLEVELSELKKQEDDFHKKEDEIAKKERLQPLNIDTIGHEGFSKCRINVIEPPQKVELSDEDRAKEMKDFVEKNRNQLLKFSMLKKWDDSKQFLLEYPELCCDNTANHLVLQCLDYEIEDKHDLMEHVAHQTIVIQYLLELSAQLKVNPQAPQLISSFFSKLKMADDVYHEAFEDELKQFKDRIRKRAQQKIEEAIKEAEEEERQKRIGPGGLDPVEVFESLPKEMQECFERQDISSLQSVALNMDAVEFQNHLKRCIDSGLWVPDANKNKDEAANGETDEVNIDQRKNNDGEKETQVRQRKPVEEK